MTSTSRNTEPRYDGPHGLPDPDAHHSTAVVLLQRFGERAATRGAPVWLEWRGFGEEVEAREVTNPHGLFGRTADPEWDGAAVVGTGRLRSLDLAHEPPAVLQPGFAGGLTMACAVHRHGGIGWSMRLPDGTSFDRVPEEGFMLDVLRRAVGLTTSPPPVSIAPLEIAAWFAAIAEASVAEDRKLDWYESLRLHPALGETAAEAAPEPLALVRDRDRIEDWDLMRRLVAAGLASTVTPDPETAAWMDAGMFSRWVLDGLPPLTELLGMVRPHLAPAALRQVHHLARALDDRERAR